MDQSNYESKIEYFSNDKNKSKMNKKIFFSFVITSLLLACNNSKNSYDASGSFETEETIISSEASGTLKQFDIQEGQSLKAGQLIGYVDSIQLFLKKKQLEAQINSLLSKKPDISTQLAALQEQLKASQAQVQEVVLKSIESASGTKAFEAVNKIALEQTRLGGQNKS